MKKEGTRAGQSSLGRSNLPASAPSLAAKGEINLEQSETPIVSMCST